MAKETYRTEASGSEGEPTGLAAFNLGSIVKGLVNDLAQLRSGKISVIDARARAQLAHEVLRGVGMAIQAQKFLEGSAKLLPNPEQPETPKKRGRKSRIIEG